jgi:hypothetical protein
MDGIGARAGGPVVVDGDDVSSEASDVEELEALANAGTWAETNQLTTLEAPTKTPPTLVVALGRDTTASKRASPRAPRRMDPHDLTLGLRCRA